MPLQMTVNELKGLLLILEFESDHSVRWVGMIMVCVTLINQSSII